MLPAPDKFQKLAMSLMLVLVLISFTFTNVYSLLWTSSEWLVSTILPAVIVDLTNDERTAENLPNLRHSTVLDAAATMKAQHMADNQYFAHFSPDNVSPWHWFSQAGYQYVHAGENLAIHFSDSDEVVEAWMDSPTHRANIVNGQFMEIGIGTARGTYQGYPTTYVVQLFGTPQAEPERTFPATVTPEPVSPMVVETATDTGLTAVEEVESVVVADTTASSAAPATASNVLAAETDTTEAYTEGAEAEEPLSSTAQPVAAPAAVTTTAAEAASTTETVSAPTTTLTMTETDTGEVFFTSSLITTTTSGTPATIGFVHQNAAPLGWHLLTQPERLLQLVYTGLAGAVFVLLVLAFLREMRHHRPIQVVYSVGLLMLMVALWSVQSLLSSGALIL